MKEGVRWFETYEEARETAAASGRPILIDFFDPG